MFARVSAVSRGPNHFASSFFDIHDEIESDKRLV